VRSAYRERRQAGHAFSYWTEIYTQERRNWEKGKQGEILLGFIRRRKREGYAEKRKVISCETQP